MTHHQTDYSRYFSLRQKATLINMSEGRDMDYFESLSGYVVGRNSDKIDLHIPYYPVDNDQADLKQQKICYKLTTEALGNGIQVMTDLDNIVAGNIFQLKLRGNLELFQRRTSQRINTALKLINLKRDISFILYKKEWKRIFDYIQAKGLPPNFILQNTTVSLSIGGIGISMVETAEPSPLSIFILDIPDNQAPVCALAEAVWKKKDQEELKCGHRFIQILKSDQERIGNYVMSLQKQAGNIAGATKINWELVDRMSVAQHESKK